MPARRKCWSGRTPPTALASEGLLTPGAAGRGDATTATPAPPSTERLNWLRAGVLGANDGVVSVAAVVVCVAGASGSTHAIVMAGFAALIGGALFGVAVG